MTGPGQTRGGRPAPARARTRAATAPSALALRAVAVATRVRNAIVTAARAATATIAPAGWFLLAVAAAGLAAGVPYGRLEFVVAGLIALGLVALAVPFLFRAHAYEIELRLARDHVVAGSAIEGVLAVRNRGSAVILPGRVDVPIGDGLIEVAVPLLRGGRQFECAVDVPAARRGIVVIGPVRAVRGDPVGIFARESASDEERTVFVHPETTPLAPASLGFIRDLEGRSSQTLVDADISFHALREYEPGDAPRRIHWKSTAKTGTLMVRQFDETRRSRTLVVLALGEDEYRSDDEFELAVSAAASLGVRGLRDGRDVDVVVSGPVPPFARRTVRSMRSLRTLTPRTLLDELAGVQRSELVHPLAEIAGLAADALTDISVAFLVCGSAQTARTIQKATLAFAPSVVVVAVVCRPDAEPSAGRLGPVPVLSIGLPGDLRHLLSQGAPAPPPPAPPPAAPDVRAAPARCSSAMPCSSWGSARWAWSPSGRSIAVPPSRSWRPRRSSPRC